jgi:hypothetical protein
MPVSLKNLSDDELVAFRNDPIAFLKKGANFANVFGQRDQELRSKVIAVSRNLGQPKGKFKYNIEETK